ncbi:hypothetical protein H6P81_017061 [Aristolochia fimbriata]|uniref:Uncharacterized protein n=1 Tax=Aristolochia fimbriata TaxID=158543 RepID=A0AAV7E1E6_ARIFI|nr:hypothetical protein H6P81_017061 [Aristolochia fimbriata]
MFRLLSRRAATLVGKLSFPPTNPGISRFSSGGSDGVPVAVQIVNYALNLARSQKSDESYGQALLVMEQGLANFRREENVQDNAAGVVLLGMSTLLSEREDLGGAREKLLQVVDSTHSCSAVKVAAVEALAAINLEMGQDAASSTVADSCPHMLADKDDTSDHMFVRARAVKGLVELVSGNLEAAQMCFTGPEYEKMVSDEGISGNVPLSHGEFLHTCGKLSLAKEFYQKALDTSLTEDFSEQSSSFSAANMSPKEVSLGAMCALGQLATHTGNFQDAEDMLMKALTKAEELYGSKHPKVGVILTSLGIMFGQKATMERSSSLLIQEGLYRRAIEVLKAPSMDHEGLQVERSDIIALARGGYGETLGVQQNRKGEGERMKKWAESVWRNRRLSLAQALDISEPSKVAVIDSRISRVL